MASEYNKRRNNSSLSDICKTFYSLMKKNILLLLLLFTIDLQAQSFIKEDYRQGLISSSLVATPDGGYALAGYFDNNAVELRKFDAKRDLQWVKTIVVDSISYIHTILEAEVLPLSDGSFILSTGIFECDIFVDDRLMRISADGSTILWSKGGSGHKSLVAGNDTTFLRNFDGDASNMEIWTIDGDLLPNNLSGDWPQLRIPLGNNEWLNVNDNQVYRSDWAGNALGLPWFTPETIRSIDTISGNGFVAFSNTKAYFLNNELNLTAIKSLPFSFANSYVFPRPCRKGFLIMGGLQLYTYNADFVKTATFNLPNAWYFKNLLVRADTFLLMAQHVQSDFDRRAWLYSDTIGVTGTWSSASDIAITGISFSGAPTGHTGITSSNFPPFTPITTYSVNYTNVFVSVKNEGTDTIQHCKLHFMGKTGCAIPFCGMLYFTISKEFDGLAIAPGATAILDFDTLVVDCSVEDLSNLCLTASEVNYRREKNDVNSQFCKFIPNLFVDTAEPTSFTFSIAPNPATERLQVTLPEGIHEIQYRIFASDGHVVQNGQFQGNNIWINELPDGFYWLWLHDKNGQYGRQKFIKNGR